MRGRDQRAYERFVHATELPMLVLSLLFLPVLLAPLVWSVSATTRTALEAAAWMIWAAFAGEYLVKLYLAADRRQMVRTHLLDLAIIALPFLRPLRALRALRVARSAAALGRAGVATRRLLTRRGFSTFLLVVLGVVVVSGLTAWAFEHAHAHGQIGTPVEGVWWALVTATTVGYGDVVPASPEGRGVAVVLMLVGIGLLSVVTANIAAYFVEESDDTHLAEIHRGVEELDKRLDRLEHLLTRHGPIQRPQANAPFRTSEVSDREP